MSRTTTAYSSLTRASPPAKSVIEILHSLPLRRRNPLSDVLAISEPQHILLLGGQMPAQVSDEDT